MDRRSFLKTTASLGALTTNGSAIPLVPLVAAAEQPPRIARIGWMSVGTPTAPALNYEVFRKAMLELGYLEGKNVVYEPRYTSGKNEVLPELIADLERAGVDVIVAGPFAALQVAKQVTGRIPIVMTPALILLWRASFKASPARVETSRASQRWRPS